MISTFTSLQRAALLCLPTKRAFLGLPAERAFLRLLSERTFLRLSTEGAFLLSTLYNYCPAFAGVNGIAANVGNGCGRSKSNLI